MENNQSTQAPIHLDNAVTVQQDIVENLLPWLDVLERLQKVLDVKEKLHKIQDLDRDFPVATNSLMVSIYDYIELYSATILQRLQQKRYDLVR